MFYITGMHYIAGACTTCGAIPSNSHYIACSTADTGCTSIVCPYQCNAGYVSEQCVNPFTQFLSFVGGVGGFSCMIVAFFVILFLPIIYYRYKLFVSSKDGDLRKLFKADLVW